MNIKKRLAEIGEEQNGYFDFFMKCPRCGINIITNTDNRACRSVHADCLICDQCRMDEIYEASGLMRKRKKLRNWAAIRRKVIAVK